MPNLTPDAQPDLASLLRGAGAAALRRARVAIPAVVASFDASKATVACQPLIDEPQAEGGHLADPALDAVPVLYPGAASARVQWPLAKGDTVLLVFLDRASDGWALGLLQSNNAQPQQPAERRWHHYSDAVAIPISTGKTTVTPGALVVDHESEIRLGENAVDALVKGTTYRNAEVTMNQTLLTAFNTPGTGLLAVLSTNAPFDNPAKLAAAMTAVAAFFVTMAAQLGTFEGGAASYLSLLVKTE